MNQLTELLSWINLRNHAHNMQLTTLNDLYQSDTSRQLKFTFSANNISIDLSNQRVTTHSLQLLLELAQERELRKKINDLMNGTSVNISEDRPALHTALRVQDKQPILVNGHNIIPDILETRENMRRVSEEIRHGHWLGYTGKPIIDIVNIGIGGSDLGPKFCINALKKYLNKNLGYHFISDVDPNAFSDTVENLNPETTLFIISSKSFTTQETLYNARKALAWLGGENCISNHIIAVTANEEKARAFGAQTIFPIWDWVGGRYSACSAINLITAIAIGFDQFSQLLLGANQMDKHFRGTEFNSNLPVLLGLIGIWNINFLHIHNLLILTYSNYLEYFVSYIQQLDMESNGKSIDNQGCAVNYSTGPIIWGGLGNQAQHSYYQLLCQGTHKVALDLITLKTHEDELIHDMYIAKQRILTHGVNQDIRADEFIPGNTPLNHIYLSNCSPMTIGELIALYEHKIYVQSVIWNINSFDQPGVDSAKRHTTEPNLGLSVAVVQK